MDESTSPSQMRVLAESNLQRANDRLSKRLSRDRNNLSFRTISLSGDSTPKVVASVLESTVEKFIEMRMTPENTNKIGKVKEIMRTLFRTSYPFALIFLTIAKTGTSVYIQ